MPNAKEIHLQLARIANGATAVSMVWHLLLVVAVAVLLLGFRPRMRAAAMALSAPLVSVAVVAFGFGNAFNGAVFALLAALLAAFAWHSARGTIAFRADWSAALGVALLVFGAVYPHFREDAAWWSYLYAAPVGVIPCPTLSVVIGAALLLDEVELRAWRFTLAGAGCFYGAFGALRLGVSIDVMLFLGSIGLWVRSVKKQPRLESGEFETVPKVRETRPAGGAARR